jgi:hypothetical protein
MTMEQVFAEMANSSYAFEDFVEEQENMVDAEADEYLDIDDGGDGES